MKDGHIREFVLQSLSVAIALYVGWAIVDLLWWLVVG